MLTSIELETFVERGFVCLRQAIPRAFAEQWWGVRLAQLPHLSDLWEPGDRHLYFPRLRSFVVHEMAPLLVDAIADLVGADRLAPSALCWGDGFVVAPPMQPTTANGPWHKDGFFRHYLDSAEVALVCVILWTHCCEDSGGTALARGSVAAVAKALASRPQGMAPKDFAEILPDDAPCDFITGEPGDVYLLHPFLLHAVRRNRTCCWRALTNPPVALRAPLRVRSEHAAGSLSPVEQAIRAALPEDTVRFYHREPAPTSLADDPAQVRVAAIRGLIGKRLEHLQEVET